MKKLLLIALFVLLFVPLIQAVDFVPSGNISGVNRYVIKNFTSISTAQVCIGGVCYTTLNAYNDTNITNQINAVNTSANIKSLGFNLTTELYTYFSTLFLSKGNESNSPLNWTYLQNYPVACPAGYAITQLNDSITCTAFGNATTTYVEANFVPYNNANNNTNLNAKNLSNVSCLTLSNGQPMCWNNDSYTLDIPTGLGNTIQVGQELTLIRKNAAGVILRAGNIVYDCGSQGEVTLVCLADANNASKIHDLGMVTIPTCNVNAACPITYRGDVHDLNTSGYTEGDNIYLTCNNPGNFTKTLPNGTCYHAHLGKVTRINVASGIVDFNVEVDYGDEPTFNNILVFNNATINGVIKGNINSSYVTNPYWLNITDQRYNESARVDSLNSTKLTDVTSANTYIGVSGTLNKTLTFNETVLNATIASALATTYYNATTLASTTGTVQGTITGIQTYNDDITYNITEVNSDINFTVNFTNVTTFNQVIVNYQTVLNEVHDVILFIYHCNTSTYDSHKLLVSTDAVLNYLSFTVQDPSKHVCNGVVSLRFSTTNIGAVADKWQFDYIAISQGISSQVGVELDPKAVHKDGSTPLSANWDAGAFNITASWFLGNLNASYVQTPYWLNITDQRYNDSARIDALNLTKRNVNDEIQWSNLTGYPVACPTNNFMTQVGDTITCTSVQEIPLSLLIQNNLTVLGTINESGASLNSKYNDTAAISAVNITAVAAMPKAGGTFTGNTTYGAGTTVILNGALPRYIWYINSTYWDCLNASGTVYNRGNASVTC